MKNVFIIGDYSNNDGLEILHVPHGLGWCEIHMKYEYITCNVS